MKKLLLIIILITTFSGVKAQEKKKKIIVENATEVSTYYLIRHAEKDTKPAKNPQLLPSGKVRAQNYAHFFKNIKLDAVYSTNYTRTKNTALPTAKLKGFNTIMYNPFSIDYKTFLKNTKGKTVLVVGHSNTIPNFVNNLIGNNEYEELDESIYNLMFIVTITNDEIKHEVKTID
ncbi:MAG: histidine phosphatase family protein [Oceanihabitans sp.]